MTMIREAGHLTFRLMDDKMRNNPYRRDVAATDMDDQSDNQAVAGARFTHPSEAEFAHLLDYYGLRWEYEPRTFVLKETEEGKPLQAFTPDFYLPDQDLFVEVTTLRQDLITKKNRKMRELRERYPDINIKLFTRQDFLALLAHWGMTERQDEFIGERALQQ